MKKRFILILLIIFSLTFTLDVYAQRGCCSWHGGVSHCDTGSGRIVCNDGTYSPSCTCEKVKTTKKTTTKKTTTSKKITTTRETTTLTTTTTTTTTEVPTTTTEVTTEVPTTTSTTNDVTTTTKKSEEKEDTNERENGFLVLFGTGVIGSAVALLIKGSKKNI